MHFPQIFKGKRRQRSREPGFARKDSPGLSPPRITRLLHGLVHNSGALLLAQVRRKSCRAYDLDTFVAVGILCLQTDRSG